MDQATQQNAALVEQMAAAASSLKGQAQELVQVVSVFRLSSDGAFLQVKDSITNKWRSFWLENGIRVWGPEVS